MGSSINYSPMEEYLRDAPVSGYVTSIRNEYSSQDVMSFSSLSPVRTYITDVSYRVEIVMNGEQFNAFMNRKTVAELYEHETKWLTEGSGENFL